MKIFIKKVGILALLTLFAFGGIVRWEGILGVNAAVTAIERINVLLDVPQSGNFDTDHPVISADGEYIAFDSQSTNLISDDSNENSDVFVVRRSTGMVERISISSDGEEGNNESSRPAISADGRYVVFTSYATNLVEEDDTNNNSDIFLRDRQLGTTERVSVSSDEEEGDGESYGHVISADGRYIVFQSYASNLVEDDTNGQPDIFIRDRQAGTTERISVSSDEEEGSSGSYEPAISADDRYVVFTSDANNLIEDDTNDNSDVFIRDRQLGTTERVSVSSDEEEGNSGSYSPTLSSDGRFVTFVSDASNLVSDDTNGQSDIFLHDRQTGTTERVSISSDEEEADDESYQPAISADGRYVVFASYATNLVPDDTNGQSDIFLHDRQTGTTERVSISSDEEESNEGSSWPALSADGRYVVFDSNASNLVPDDTNDNSDVFIRDRDEGTTTIPNAFVGPLENNGDSFNPSLSLDNNIAAFDSESSNLIFGDTNESTDVFILNRLTSEITRASVSSDEEEGNASSYSPQISANGRYVVFASDADNLVEDDSNDDVDVFVRDLELGTTELISVSYEGTEAFGGSYDPAISTDGRYVAFVSEADNIVEADTNNQPDVFIRDRQLGTTERISVSSDEEEGDAESVEPSISFDGRYVAFASRATNFAPAEFDNVSAFDVFVRDTQTGTTTLVSKAHNAFSANHFSRDPAISGDGAYIAFESMATNLVEGGTGDEERTDIFVYSMATDTIKLASVSLGGEEAYDTSERASLSSDGRFIAYYSLASNIVGGDENNAADIFVYDRTTGETLLVSKAMDGTQIASNVYNGGDNYDYFTNRAGLFMSLDGGYVLFASNSPDLIAGVTPNARDIFLVTLGDEVPENTDERSRSRVIGSVGREGILPEQTPIENQPALPEVHACSAQHFDEYLRRGQIGVKVTKVQQFLKERGFYTGQVNGYFGPQTEAAVKRFQAQYVTEVLAPWGLSKPTGFWGKTTRAMANKFEGCHEGTIILPNGTAVEF